MYFGHLFPPPLIPLRYSLPPYPPSIVFSLRPPKRLLITKSYLIGGRKRWFCGAEQRRQT